jgi:hypothetical protein
MKAQPNKQEPTLRQNGITSCKEYETGVQDGQDAAYACALDGQTTEMEAMIIENISGMIADAHDGCPLAWRLGWVCGFALEFMKGGSLNCGTS